MKSKIKSVLRKILSIAKIVLSIIAMIAFFVIPFVNELLNKVIAQIIWYPSLFIFFVDSVKFIKSSEIISPINWINHIYKKSLLPCIVLIGSAFIINYYTTSYTWWWAIFVFVAVSILAFILGIRSYAIEEKSYTDVEIKNLNKWYVKLGTFYGLLDLLYMSIFMYWQRENDAQLKWLIWQFVFGITAIVIIFCNLVQVFLKSKDKKMFLLIQDFILGIAITVYLVFLIPNEVLRNVVLTIVAAVFGGLITLVGVAWTIKDNAEKLKEERKFSIRPYLETSTYHYKDISNLPVEDTVYIDISKDVLRYQWGLPTDIRHLREIKIKLDNNEKVDSIDFAMYHVSMEDFPKKKHLLQYKVFNHGAGNAINVQMKINRWELKPFCITTSNPKNFVMILNDSLIQEGSDKFPLKITFMYTDTASMGRYRQTEEIILSRDKYELRTVQWAESLLTTPEEIT